MKPQKYELWSYRYGPTMARITQTDYDTVYALIYDLAKSKTGTIALPTEVFLEQFEFCWIAKTKF